MSSSTQVRKMAVTRTGQSLPQIKRDEAVSFLAPFPVVEHILRDQPPPKRPNRNRPIHTGDKQLHEEFAAWEAASDEAYQAMEDDLME